ncbi:MAG: hypothetical protein WB919_13580, partial [Candidatus Sulfotelmatobacter sp.]
RNDVIQITDSRAYVKRLHIFFTFITGNIINKDSVLAAGPVAFSSLIGTGLVQLGWTYTALNRFTRGLFIREKLIAARQNNSGGYKLLQVFGPTFARVTNEWLESERLVRVIMNATAQRYWPITLLQYKKCANDYAEEPAPQEVLTPIFKNNIRYWLFAYPVIVLPSLLAALWVFAGRVLNRADKAAGFPMLDW